MQHIEQTLIDIEAQLSRLNQLRSLIIQAFGICVPAEPSVTLPTAPAVPVKVKGKPGRKPKAKLAPAPVTATRSAVLNNPSITSAVRKLAEPFTVHVLMSNGIFPDSKSASNFLYRAKGKGWLKPVGRGQFARTKDFGADITSTAAATLADIHGEITRDAEAK